MLIYRHCVIMAYSEKFSDIIVLEQREVYSTKNPIKLLHWPKHKSKKGNNSVESLQMTFKLELDLYFMMLDHSVIYK